MAEVCMSNFDPAFSSIAQPGDVLLAGFNFGCGSSREQAATAILAKQISLAVAGSFGNIFSRNSINNALLGLELPGLVHLLRKCFSETVPKENQLSAKSSEDRLIPSGSSAAPANTDDMAAPKKVLTRRTDLKLRWDVRRSLVEVTDSRGKIIFRQKVGEMPPNVQDIIACGGLEKWVKREIEKM